MEIVIRAAIAFVILWAVTRASGRSTLGELSSFDLLLFVTMGDLIQQGVTMEDRSITGGLLAVGTIAVLAFVLGLANSRWPRIGRLLQGRPVVLIHNGRIDRGALKRERIGINELAMMARLERIEDFGQVRVAILEANGKVSFFTHATPNE